MPRHGMFVELLWLCRKLERAVCRPPSKEKHRTRQNYSCCSARRATPTAFKSAALPRRGIREAPRTVLSDEPPNDGVNYRL